MTPETSPSADRIITAATCTKCGKSEDVKKLSLVSDTELLCASCRPSSTLFQKEKAQALLDLLRSTHAEEYTGLDDDMSDSFDSWVSNLTDDEVAQICISVFRNGI